MAKAKQVIYRWNWELWLQVHREGKTLYCMLLGEEAWKKKEKHLIKGLKSAPVGDHEPYGA